MDSRLILLKHNFSSILLLYTVCKYVLALIYECIFFTVK